MGSSTALLDLVASASSQKDVVVDGLADALSQAGIFGRRSSTTTGLTWGYYGGRFTKDDGTNIAIANGTVALTGSQTNYIEADTAGAISSNTSAFTAGRIPLYTVVAGASTVTSYTDNRDGTQGTYALRNNKKRISTLSYGATIAVDWSLCDIARVTLTGNPTFTFAGAVDGQSCILEITQDGTGSRTVTFPTSVRWSTDLPLPTLTTTASKMDRIGFLYNGSASKYDGIAVVKGY